MIFREKSQNVSAKGSCNWQRRPDRLLSTKKNPGRAEGPDSLRKAASKKAWGTFLKHKYVRRGVMRWGNFIVGKWIMIEMIIQFENWIIHLSSSAAGSPLPLDIGVPEQMRRSTDFPWSPQYHQSIEPRAVLHCVVHTSTSSTKNLAVFPIQYIFIYYFRLLLSFCCS